MPRFHEEQRFRQPWLVILLAATTTFTAWEAAQGLFLPLLLVLLVDGFFYVARLTVTVDEDALHIRFAPLHHTPRTIPLDTIEAVERERYPVIGFGGWGIRFRPGSVAYSVSGMDAVRVERGEERTIHVGTQRPDDLLDALRG